MMEYQQPIMELMEENKMSMKESSVITNVLLSPRSILIGDFSRPHCLPLIKGKHCDLKSISVDTLRRLLNGEFDEEVSSFKIIDCRYPYEFEGGHIVGASNLHTKEQILEELILKKASKANSDDSDKRHILVFHCEFSAERGPKLSRFLRKHDRFINSYPSLHYPEVYLLHGGYKAFYEKNADLCEPHAYRSMIDASFADDYKNYRDCDTSKKAGKGKEGIRSTAKLTRSRSKLLL